MKRVRAICCAVLAGLMLAGSPRRTTNGEGELPWI